MRVCQPVIVLERSGCHLMCDRFEVNVSSFHAEFCYRCTCCGAATLLTRAAPTQLNFTTRDCILRAHDGTIAIQFVR